MRTTGSPVTLARFDPSISVTPHEQGTGPPVFSSPPPPLLKFDQAWRGWRQAFRESKRRRTKQWDQRRGREAASLHRHATKVRQRDDSSEWFHRDLRESQCRKRQSGDAGQCPPRRAAPSPYRQPAVSRLRPTLSGVGSLIVYPEIPPRRAASRRLARICEQRSPRPCPPFPA